MSDSGCREKLQLRGLAGGQLNRQAQGLNSSPAFTPQMTLALRLMGRGSYRCLGMILIRTVMTIRITATWSAHPEQRMEGTRSVMIQGQCLPLLPGLSCEAKSIFLLPLRGSGRFRLDFASHRCSRCPQVTSCLPLVDLLLKHENIVLAMLLPGSAGPVPGVHVGDHSQGAGGCAGDFGDRGYAEVFSSFSMYGSMKQLRDYLIGYSQSENLATFARDRAFFVSLCLEPYSAGGES